MAIVDFVTASLTDGQTAELECGYLHTGRVYISGTWSGELYSEVSMDQSTWYEVAAFKLDNPDGQPIIPIIDNDTMYGFSIAGFNFCRVRAVLLSGTIDLQISVDNDTSILNAIVSNSSVSGPLTDAQLRASPVDITGSISATNPSVSTTGTAVPASGTLIAGSDGTDLKAVKVSATGVVSVDGSASTQPISAASLPLPAGAATDTLQSTGNTSLSNIDTKIPVLGQALAAASIPVVLTAAQMTTLTPVSSVTANAGTNLNTSTLALEAGGNLEAVKNVNIGTTSTYNFTTIGQSVTMSTVGQNTVTLSITSVFTGTLQCYGYDGVNYNLIPYISLGLTTLGTPANNITVAGVYAINVGGYQSIKVIATAVMTGTAAVKLSAGLGVQGVAVYNKDYNSLVTKSVLYEGLGVVPWTMGLTGYTNCMPVSLATDQPAISVMEAPTRTAKIYYAVAAAAGTTTTETAITLTKSSGTAATSTGTSFVITNGTKFRIESITVATRGHNTATAQTTTFNLRINTAGAVTTTSTPLILSVRCATPATANSWDRASFPIPNGGYEITGNGTIQFGITAAATYTTNAPTWDVTIIGYEY